MQSAPNLFIVRADTRDDWRESVAIQKQVYCTERRFESLEDHEDPDQFDALDVAQSRRVLVVTGDGTAVATTRIIEPGVLNLPACALSERLYERMAFAAVLECSGFCCSDERMRRYALNTPEIRAYITSLLIGGMCALALECGAQHAVMAVERRLHAYLRRTHGISLHIADGPVAYHGTRYVCYIDIFGELLPGMLQRSPQRWAGATNNGALRSLFGSRHATMPAQPAA